MNYLVEAMQHLGVYYTPSRVLALATAGTRYVAPTRYEFTPVGDGGSFAPFPYTSPDKYPTIHADASGSLLADALAAAVPFKIHDLVLMGGPSDYQWEQAISNGQIAMEKADELMYGKKKGEPAKLFGYLADAIAVLAFVPGGITIFGNHYEAYVRDEIIEEMQQVPAAQAGQ